MLGLRQKSSCNTENILLTVSQVFDRLTIDDLRYRFLSDVIKGVIFVGGIIRIFEVKEEFRDSGLF